MKRKCKHIDITDVSFILEAVELCFSKKSKKQMNRRDIREYLAKHQYSYLSIAMEMSACIKEKKLPLVPIRYKEIKDRSNGKIRIIGIEEIKQQLYDYVAYLALEDLMPRIGFYHIACQKGKGPELGASYIKAWLKEKDLRYALKLDIEKCYPSIKHDLLLAFLNKHIKNDDLLWLIEALLATSDKGLLIGSVISIRLSALYLSELYHFIEELHKERRGKKIPLVKHQLFFMDDILLLGTSAKDLHTVKRLLDEKASSMGLSFRKDWRLLDLSHKHSHIDMMGYRIYKDRMTLRRSTYLKLRKSMKRFKKHPSFQNAKNLISTSSRLSHTDSTKFRRKYQTKPLFKKARRIISNHDKVSNQTTDRLILSLW